MDSNPSNLPAEVKEIRAKGPSHWKQPQIIFELREKAKVGSVGGGGGQLGQ